MTKKKENTRSDIPVGPLEEIRDLSDFCEKWSELRPTVSDDSLAASSLPDQSREVIRWLTLLADRVCKIKDF